MWASSGALNKQWAIKLLAHILVFYLFSFLEMTLILLMTHFSPLPLQVGSYEVLLVLLP